MRNYFLAFALVFSVLSSIAQTNIFPADGNVGVGILTPQSWFPGNVLQVNGTRPILRLSPSNEGGLATILFKGSYNEAPGTPDEFHFNYVSSLTQPRITLGSSLTGGWIALSILGNGNVGIGTEFPNDKLAVNGNIRAKEIKVETSNWPDYVFEKSYELPTLQETEKYIKAKGHLPGIPSTKEVEAEGINLGEMNAKLLQKIEELTLYMIEQDKRLNEQEKFFKEQISAQQIEIEKLKRRP